ncbi:MAG: Gfo/Idh/MocA family oxidoreductase [Armatimonadota bacterium]|nr:Gfo/Idh/MocA family oxidoreductase [Armatimonadota bacterium]MCX7776847.1 Gfo/Idh/MocA family oxidoreductase [Armatimonadota bacterium]MDW8024467.1 Gfo/Idh/MocA family oxidoreductase [Armatimonadota bacterium]
MSERKVRIGFIGCGGIAQQHMNALSNIPESELVAFCDIDIERARAAAKQHGGRAFDNAETMLKEIELDAVWISLPPHAHGIELKLIERGIPFFVEKPVGLDLGLIREIASAVEEKGLLTSVGYMNRYRRGINRARELLQDDQPILILGGWIGGTPRPRPGVTIWRWWVEKDKSGGQFHEQVTHTVDLARFLCGEVVEVHAFSASGLNKGAPENYNIEDASVVNLKFANGAVANLWACCAANAGGGGVSLSVYANRTTVLFTGWEHNARIMRVGEDTIEIAGEPNIFEIEDRAFMQAILTGDRTLIKSPYPDGAKTAEVTLAANKSMETGKPVSLV